MSLALHTAAFAAFTTAGFVIIGWAGWVVLGACCLWMENNTREPDRP